MDEDRSRNLETLGSDWVRFYSTQADSTGLSPDEVYHILALASAIASPQVLLDVADLCRSMSDQPLEVKQEMNQTAKAYWLYNHAEASIISNQVRQRGLAVFLYQQFEGLASCRLLIPLAIFTHSFNLPVIPRFDPDADLMKQSRSPCFDFSNTNTGQTFHLLDRVCCCASELSRDRTSWIPSPGLTSQHTPMRLLMLE